MAVCGFEISDDKLQLSKVAITTGNLSVGSVDIVIVVVVVFPMESPLPEVKSYTL
jgi:hypothetical protein